MKALFGNAKKQKEEQDYKTDHGRTSSGAFREGVRVFIPLDSDHGTLPVGTNYEVPGAGTVTLYDGKVRIVDSTVFNHELSQYKKRKKQVEDLADAFLDSGDNMCMKYLGYYYKFLPKDQPSEEKDIEHLGKCIMADGYTNEQAKNIIREDIRPYDGRPTSITAEVQTSENFIHKLNKLIWIIRYVGIVFTDKETAPQPGISQSTNESLFKTNDNANVSAKEEAARSRGIDGRHAEIVFS